MFYVVTIEKVVRLEPFELGKNIMLKIRQKLEQSNVGTCTGNFGYIIQILSLKNEDVQDGRIQDTTGEVIYRAKFQAITFRPFKGEVLDGIVEEVSSSGITIESGPLRSFISKLRLDNYFEYNQATNQYISKQQLDVKIRQGVQIRYKIDQIKFDKGDFTAVSSIEDDDLGPLE